MVGCEVRGDNLAGHRMSSDFKTEDCWRVLGRGVKRSDFHFNIISLTIVLSRL